MEARASALAGEGEQIRGGTSCDLLLFFMLTRKIRIRDQNHLGIFIKIRSNYLIPNNCIQPF